MVRISKHQLFCLLLLFEIGSSSLFVLGIEAKQDAWIAILLATLGGFLLILAYTELQKLFPEDNFVEIIIKLLGKLLGIPLAATYGLLFFYKSCIIFNEFANLLGTSYLPRSPMLFIMLLSIIPILYISFLGLEVLGRSSEVLMPIFLFFLISTYILILASGRINLKELLPILENGIKPVFLAGYPRILNFPYGEALVFLMYWRHVNPKKEVRKTSLVAIGVYGLLITTSSIVIISVLGAEYASHATIPIITVVKLINIANIITNLDAIATTIIFIGGFYKIIIFFYGGILVVSTLLKTKNNTLIILVSSISVIWFSFYFIQTYQFNMWLGKNIHPFFINTALQNIIPIFLLGIAYIKNKRKKIKENKIYKDDQNA